MRSEGSTGAAIPDTRGVPLPAGPRGGVHVLDRPRPAPAQSGWFRRPEPGEFTPEQLARAGYRAAGTGAAPRKKAGARKAPTEARRPRVDHALVVRLYTEDGLSIVAIKERTGYAPDTIRRHLDSAGIERHPTRRRARGPGFDVDAAARLVRDGATHEAAAQQLGISVDHLGRTLRRAGHTTPRAGRTRRSTPKFDHAAAIAEYLAGESSLSVGARHGVTANAVLHVVKAAGHTPRPAARKGQRTGPRPTTPVTDIVRLYVDEQVTINAIAQRLHLGPRTVRLALLDQGVTLRDDRSRFSGGRNRIAEPVLRAAGELYSTGLTKEQVAERLGIGIKAVDKGIAFTGGAPRPAANVAGAVPGRDTLGALRDLMTDNATTAAQVRAWAATTGRDCPTRGMPPRALVEDYLLATTPTRRSTTS